MITPLKSNLTDGFNEGSGIFVKVDVFGGASTKEDAPSFSLNCQMNWGRIDLRVGERNYSQFASELKED